MRVAVYIFGLRNL